jgi:hypothetical protein
MKKSNLKILFIFLCLSIFLNGCYTSTIDSFSKFNVQLTLNFNSYFYHKGAPDTNISFANLNKYEQYIKSKSLINEAQVVQFNYWIDSLELDNFHPFDPDKDSVVFSHIRFSIKFAVPKTDSIKNLLNNLSLNDPAALDSSNWMPDPNGDSVILGEFRDVNVSDYYRNPQYIQVVNQKVTEIITEMTKNRPQFYIVTEYSKTVGQTVEKRQFPLIWSKYDMVLRLQVKL